MAKISVIFTPSPDVPKRTEDNPTTFVQKWETYEDFRSTTNYNELVDFKTQANALRDEVNDLRAATIVSADSASSANASAQQAKDSAQQASADATTSKAKAETAYNNTASLIDTLVLPMEATYNYEEIDRQLKIMNMKKRLNYKF